MTSEKKAVVDAIWMKYYVRYMFEHGAITEDERNRLIIKINNRYKMGKVAL